MKRPHKSLIKFGNSKGGVLVLISILLIVLIGVAALAIDIGYVATTKNELQNVADAAALAGTSRLGQFYKNSSTYGTGVIGTDEYDAVLEVASMLDGGGKPLNKAAGVEIDLDGNIQVGEWDFTTHTFTAFTDFSTPLWPNAVKATAKRVTGSNKPISSLFAGIFGIDSIGVSADAVAALSGQAEFDPGEIKLPLAISEFQFPDACQDPIVLNSNTDCAAWHIFGTDNPENDLGLNANEMGDVLIGIILDHPDGAAWLVQNYPDIKEDKIPLPFEAPTVVSGTTEFELTEGGVTSMFTGDATNPVPMQALFDFYKAHDDDDDYEFPDKAPYNSETFDPDTVWVTSIPVYGEPEDATYPTCNPTSKNTFYPIVGAADIIVTNINGPSDGKNIDIDIVCSYKEIRGGGGTGGNIGTIPNLVE